MNIELPPPGRELKVRTTNSAPEIYDPVRRKWVAFTPEEHVRQYIIHYLTHTLHYPIGMIAVEKAVETGSTRKRFDIVVYNRSHMPWMLIECKRPDVAIDKDVLWQLLNYHNHLQCHYWLLTNGHTTYCADAGTPTAITWQPSIPLYPL
jgi:hypothetical protein